MKPFSNNMVNKKNVENGDTSTVLQSPSYYNNSTEQINQQTTKKADDLLIYNEGQNNTL